jgi:uncharacterized membrane protein (UPF0127 family)
MIRRLLVFVVFGNLTLYGCNENLPRGSSLRNDLSKMATENVTITNRAGQKHTFSVWLARTPQEVGRGLMNVTEDELPHDRGMLFVFPYDQVLGFWMRNTIIPLDIAYIRSDGTIVRTLTMKPLDESTYPSIEPARFALEVRAGELAARSIAPGDHVEIPASVLNSNP